MRISPVKTPVAAAPAFKAKIIDGHAHLGKWGDKYYGVEMLDKFIKEPININVDGVKSQDTLEKMIVSSAFAITDNGRTADELTGNEQMLKMIEGKKEYVPIAVCQPNKTGGDISKLEELFNKYPEKFKGLKFHPTALPMENENDFMKAYEPYMKFAQKKKLPCFFHCQGGQASAWNIYDLAQKTPEVPVILGHSGSIANGENINRENAIKVFEDALKTKKANIYMDLSWVDWSEQGFPSKEQPNIKRILTVAKENNGLNKVMFGTDAPLGCFGEWESPHFNNKTCYSDTVNFIKKTVSNMFGRESKKVNNKIFYENASQLYLNTLSPKQKLIKKGSIAAGAVLLCAAGAAFFLKNNSKSGTSNTELKSKINTRKK